MPTPPNVKRLVLAALCGLLAPAWAAAATPREYSYVSPVPGADKVSRWNNVAIRAGGALDAGSLAANALTVTGSLSGPHLGRTRVTSDGRTLLFTPTEPYALGETVTVRLAAGTRTSTGATLPELTYSFAVSSVDPRRMPRPEPERLPDPPEPSAWWQSPSGPAATTTGPCDTLLPGFPDIAPGPGRPAGPGVYFLAPFASANQSTARLGIQDDLGRPIYQRVFQDNFLPTDFKRQPDGRLTFWMNGAYKYYAMDSAYGIVDSFTTGNGYFPDLHELQVLPNGHALMMSYDPQPVGMDTVVAGGNPNAIVFGLIVQELDEQKDVIFQWRSWDHFRITDASVSPLVNLQSAVIDYVHANSIDLCPDGNLVVSCRHMNEITKIDRQTGDILWRMGRNAVNNQFTFPNDTRGFSHTHDARVLPNGHLTVFDNGNGLSPAYSRALEFELDEENLVATVVWQFRSTPDIVSGFMGNVQRHADGTTTIGWGGAGSNPKMTELDAQGTPAYSLVLPTLEYSYRTFRFPWRTTRIRTDVDSLAVTTPEIGTTAGQTFKVWNGWDRPLDITCLRTADDAFTATPLVGGLPITLAPGETTGVQVLYTASTQYPMTSRLYIMQVQEGELVAQTVELEGSLGGTGNVGVAPEAGVALASMARPNPLRARTTIEYTLPSSGPVRLEIFDVVGRRVATLVNGVRASGRHQVEWDATGRAGGLYFYKLRAGGQTLVRKVMVTG